MVDRTYNCIEKIDCSLKGRLGDTELTEKLTADRFFLTNFVMCECYCEQRKEQSFFADKDVTRRMQKLWIPTSRTNLSPKYLHSFCKWAD